jgi:hypothetical protein
VHARPLAPLALALLVTLGASVTASPDAAAEDALIIGSLSEQAYEVEVVPGPDMTTLEVTRTFFNPTLEHQRLRLSLDLPSEAVLDGFEIAAHDAKGTLRWVAGQVEQPDRAHERFTSAITSEGDAEQGDLIGVLSRSYGDMAIDVFPVPPLRERSVRYRIQLPNHYDAGRYHVTVPVLSLGVPGAASANVVVQLPTRGYALHVDGKPRHEATTLSGALAHELELVPGASDEARASLAAIDLRELGVRGGAAGIVAAQLDLPPTLVELPQVRRAVLVLDGSHSLPRHEREALVELGRAYLDALAQRWPDARARVLSFDHEVHEHEAGFVEPHVAMASLAAAVPDSRNGSDVDLALAHARASLEQADAAEPGVDWIVLLGDLELRSDFPYADEQRAAAASDIHLHVVEPGAGLDTLSPGVADDPWAAIADAAAGGYFVFEGRDDRLALDGAELLAPTRVWQLRAHHDDARKHTHTIQLASVADAGTRNAWLERIDASPGERVRFEAETWAGPLRWTARTSDANERRWAGILARDASAVLDSLVLDLVEPELAALAEHAAIASPWTSLLAELRLDGTSPAAPTWGTGGMMSGRSMGSTRCGGVTRASRRPWIDLALLRDEVLAALEPCGEGHEVTLELFEREIVVVASRNACARAAMWALDLRSWPLTGRTQIQAAHGGSGPGTYQMTSLAGDAAVSWLE